MTSRHAPPAVASPRRRRHRLPLAGLAVALASGLVPAAASPQDEAPAPGPAELILEGEKLLERERYEEALQVFERAAAATGGRSVRALDGRIQALLKLGRHAEAEQAAREMLALSPQPIVQAFGHNYLGAALLWRASLMPGLEEGAERTAEVQAEQRRLFERSAEEFRAAAELGGERAAEVRLSLAQVLIQLGDAAEARTLVTAYLEGGGAPEAVAALSCQLGLAGEREGKPPARSLLEPGVAPPVKKHAPPPEVTPAARNARVRGTIYLDLVIDENGRVRCPRILSGLAYGLNEATLHELRRWRFEPARAGGEPVPVVYGLGVSFSVQ